MAYRRSVGAALLSVWEHLVSLEAVLIRPAPPPEDEGTLERRGRVILSPRKSKDPKAIHIALGSECCAEASLTSLLFLLDLNQGPSD